MADVTGQRFIARAEASSTSGARAAAESSPSGSTIAAVVLAGGAARRMGGATKPTLTVGGEAMLTRVLRAAAGTSVVIVVGPPELAPNLPPGTLLTCEDPPGGGPVAALAAGLTLLPADATPPPTGAPSPTGTPPQAAQPPRAVAVLASDLPFLLPGAVEALRREACAPGVDAAVLADGGGRAQWLCGVWRLDPLRARLTELGRPSGRSMREVADGLRVALVSMAAPGPPAWFDCDTKDDLRQAEEWAHDNVGGLDP
jgi:molybdopterin-guanine dinucleotide biosynthesis protein A